MASRRGILRGLAAIGFVGLIAFVWSGEARRRADREARLREAAARAETLLRQGTIPHAPLLGQPGPGEATELYSRAIALCQRARPSGDTSWDPDEMSAEAALPPKLDELLEPYRPALEALAAAAAAGTIDAQSARTNLQNWVAIKKSLVFPFTSSLTNLAAVAIRLDLAKGRVDAAVQRTADALTLQADLAAERFGMVELLAMAGIAVLCTAWDDDALRTASHDAVRSLARVLESAEARLPSIGETFAGELLFCLRLRDSGREGDSVAPSALVALHEAVELLLPTDNAAWSVRRAALEESKRGRSDHDVLDLAAVETARRTAVARLRLLRIACAHHLGERLALADPLGDGDLPIETRDATTIVVRSAGLDEGKPLERTVQRR